MKGFKISTPVAVAAFVLLIGGIFFYGMFIGDIPGVPKNNARLVTINLQIDKLPTCIIPASVSITSVGSTPNFCSNPVSTGDVEVTALLGGNAVATTYTNSCCNGCEVNSCNVIYGCNGVRYPQVKLCLTPGVYTITAKWAGVTATKQITVT